VHNQQFVQKAEMKGDITYHTHIIHYNIKVVKKLKIEILI